MIKTDVVIVGAGPVGLFAVHQLGIKGLKAEVIDNLDRAGGQCIELYPDKPIYDIPARNTITGQELTNELMKQSQPFKPIFHLNQQVESIEQLGIRELCDRSNLESNYDYILWIWLFTKRCNNHRWN